MAGQRRKGRGISKRAAARLLALFFALALAAALLISGIRLYKEAKTNEAAIESLMEESRDESARIESLRDKLDEGVTESDIKEGAHGVGLAESGDTVFRVEPQK